MNNPVSILRRFTYEDEKALRVVVDDEFNSEAPPIATNINLSYDELRKLFTIGEKYDIIYEELTTEDEPSAPFDYPAKVCKISGELTGINCCSSEQTCTLYFNEDHQFVMMQDCNRNGWFYLSKVDGDSMLAIFSIDKH